MDDSKQNVLRIFNLAYKKYFKDQHVFDDLYQAVKGFYRSPGGGEVEQALQKLFDELLVRTFVEAHDAANVSVISLSNRYRDCLLTTAKEADPFGDEDDGITRQVMRALNSTSVFLAAIQTAGRVLDGFLEVRPTEQCVNEYMRMQPCSLCGGLIDARPCSGLCKKVLSDCLGGLSGFNTAFNEYLDAAVDMITQLENTSPEVLLGDLGTQLSFSIMAAYSQIAPSNPLGKRIKLLCGRLGGGKRRRAVDGLAINPVKPTSVKPTLANHPPDMDLSVQLMFAKEALSLFQSSIGNTANEICYRSSEQTGSDCWNGTTMGR